MEFYHLGSGGVTLSGCAGFGLYKNYSNIFEAGDRVWIVRKAAAGEMESVVVKKVYVYDAKESDFTYLDTFNRVWLERELTNQANATNLAESYRIDLARRKKAAFKRIVCFPIKREGCD